MDASNSSDTGERSWDRPWTIDEMREHKDNWSLACDVGLFRHLQKFSDDLTDKVRTTQSSLDLLVNDLKESSVMIENVTNVSLGLANTQFIESRVYEDETVEKEMEKTSKIEKNQELTEAEMMAVVNESIKQSLEVMNEKYERIEVLASSESEDETDVQTPSVILKPQNPYQNRPLPYVIGSEKWKASSKIGLESSSSESDIADEQEEDEFSESDRDIKISDRIYETNKHVLPRSRSSISTSSSGSSRYDEKSDTNGASSRTYKIHTKSQDTLNSTSDIETPVTGVSRDNYKKSAPSFAEELAKRLGNVLPIHKSDKKSGESDEASINRSKDDLFDSDNENDDALNSETQDIFSNKPRIFDEKVSNSLWKESIKKKQTIIPPSLDVPPPINSIETKPKSAIDDLFGDNDSEDSDDIFAPKNSKFMNKSDFTSENVKTRFDNVLDSQNDDNVMTSTPEANNNIPNLFEDDDDDGNLFSPIEHIKNRTPEAIRNSSIKPSGIIVNQSDLISSVLGNRLFNRPRNDYSDSSENESIEPDNHKNDGIEVNESQQNVSTTVDTSESMVSGNMPRAGGNNEITTDSSGISIQPTSVNSTLGLSLKIGEPQMESTRLLSEEIYREQRTNDSLLNTRSRQIDVTTNSTNNSNIHNQAQHDLRIQESSSGRQEDIFDSDDVFGPPPLPKATSKSKSKVNSLFDDSDSGDDLFSNTSSGSRSQKSTDQAGTTQFIEKSKANKSLRSGNLFDDGLNVFSTSTAPDIDIFTESSTGQEPKIQKFSVSKATNELAKSSIKLSIDNTNLFNEEEEDDENLFDFNKEKSVSIVNTNENKTLALVSNITEEIKKDSAVITMNSEEIKNTGKSNLTNSHNLFDDVDEEDDDSLFNQKSEIKIEASDKMESVTDGPSNSKQKSTEVTKHSVKKMPPNSLKIRLPIPGSDDSMQIPKRAVSGKIKNLMGKMGDLKILSPTDTPPLLRKSGEKLNLGDETPDQDTEDGSIISVPKTPPSPKIVSNEAPPQSPSILDTETAVSFDVPAQVETLSIASKSRAKIPTKRRPQSRQARQTALRHSGIDFHSVDSVGTIQPASNIQSEDNGADIHRLSKTADESLVKPSLNLLSDDKSEISLGKESSMSITRNTLLSPSTDEEDLFDVPPDLPEDPQKEDALFGRAPILSPVVHLNESVGIEKEDEKTTEEMIDGKSVEEIGELSDPLRSINDPLKDPSQLFAFVTKTPSPEKGHNSLAHEDDNESLFSRVPNKKIHDSEGKKSSLDLFADDDSGGDLFAGPFTKSIGKKSTKEQKTNLFDDIDSDEEETGDDLFGSASSKRSNYSKSEASEVDVNDAICTLGNTPKSTNVFGEDDDEDDEELFFDASEKPTDSSKDDQLFSSTSKILKTKLEDIFGEPSGGDDDIFSTKITKDSGEQFSNCATNNENVDHMATNKFTREKPQETRGSIKKSVTKDLKKTAEKIVEDPLSMFQDE